ncbi:MAG: 30S ribosomal protein S12 methylthiotransferase RimO [Deferribacteraceae bacterium]|jgi:ribosomal protein S12 methylthiotransferase|nr:30S ribosomal protein S12 methylthiotransferase RimO [Deferribacteraceae bacterium]
MKLALISLGCPKNQVDLEHFAGSLSEQITLTPYLDEADIVVINSCGFIREAVEETLTTLSITRESVKSGVKIALMGCLPERYRASLPESVYKADFIAGVNEFDKLCDYIRSLDKELFIKADTAERCILNPPTYAYLKISEGCSNRCTYCTIPQIRGDHRSFEREALLEEARSLAEKGVKEIILIAQDITKYGRDRYDGYYLPELLDELAAAFSSIYFRLLYLNPDGISDELIKVVQKHENIIRYFDIPLQHVSDNILRQMGRHYNIDEAKNVLDKIRSALPDAFIRSTFIVGFPGEAEDDFKLLIDFLKEYKPDYAGFFIYSSEIGTPAQKFPKKVAKKRAIERLKKLQTVQKNNTLTRLKKLKGEEISIFVDQPNKEHNFVLESHALFQTPEIDGITYVIKGRADRGVGLYKAKIKRVIYPDIFVELI